MNNLFSGRRGRALGDRSHADFSKTLRWLVAQLQDGHGGVRDPRHKDRASLPVELAWIEAQVVVLAASPASGLLPGDVVLTIDGQAARARLEQAEELVSGSPQWRRLSALQDLFDGKAGTVVELTVRRSGESRTVRLHRQDRPEVPQDRRPPLDKLESGAWYVNLDQAPWEEIAARMEEIASAPGVIFDLRGYPKGNHAVIQHLLREPDRSEGWMMVPQITRPDRGSSIGYQKEGWGLTPLAPRIQGKVAFITGPGAISYAESFMSFIEHYKLGEIVGEPTAGTNGNVNPFDVPGGFRVVFTGMKVVKHDGSQLHHVGIRPTVPVQRTIEGVRLGRDEPFEAALRLVSTR